MSGIYSLGIYLPDLNLTCLIFRSRTRTAKNPQSQLVSLQKPLNHASPIARVTVAHPLHGGTVPGQKAVNGWVVSHTMGENELKPMAWDIVGFPEVENQGSVPPFLWW